MTALQGGLLLAQTTRTPGPSSWHWTWPSPTQGATGQADRWPPSLLRPDAGRAYMMDADTDFGTAPRMELEISASDNH
jgi:hypothetical protein